MCVLHDSSPFLFSFFFSRSLKLISLQHSFTTDIWYICVVKVCRLSVYVYVWGYVCGYVRLYEKMHSQSTLVITCTMQFFIPSNCKCEQADYLDLPSLIPLSTHFSVCVCNLWHRLVEKENANKRKQRQFNALLPLFSLFSFLLLLLLLQCMLSIIISDKFVMHKCTQTHLYTSKIQPLVHNRAHLISSLFVFILKYMSSSWMKSFSTY